jgi:hypothetical protein
MCKKVLALALLLLAGLAGVIASRPSSYLIERSTHVLAPSRAVYERVADFRRWSEWSPWAHLDPQMKQSFAGASSGVGAEYAWTSDSRLGAGTMSIVEARTDERVTIRMHLTQPLTSTSTTELHLSPEGGGVRVAWTMHGRRGFLEKAAAFLARVDATLGKDFEDGLAALKRSAEADGTAAAARR